MAGYDYRTASNDADLTFYVFDNLRSMQDHEGGNVFRYDHIDEAVALFQYLQTEHPDWTIALGGSMNNTREIDFIQRRMGDNVLVNDYQMIDVWKGNQEVHDAIGAAVPRLGVEWQADRQLIGSPLLVPCIPEDAPLDPYLAGKELRLPEGSKNVLASIQEAFAEGKGWLSLPKLQEMSRAYGYHNPECPKVTRFNVAYESRTDGGRYTGYVDVSPSDFKAMKLAYGAKMLSSERHFGDLAKEAKERAAEKNLGRPRRNAPKGHELAR